MEYCRNRPLLQIKKDLWGAEVGLKGGGACGAHVEGTTEAYVFWGMIVDLSKNFA